MTQNPFTYRTPYVPLKVYRFNALKLFCVVTSFLCWVPVVWAICLLTPD